MDFSSVLFGRQSDQVHRAPKPSQADAFGSSDDTSHTDVVQPSSFSFLDVLDVLRQYEVPSVDLESDVGTTKHDVRDAPSATSTLEQPVNRERPLLSHALGGGYSAIVLKHTPRNDISAAVTHRDAIALTTPEIVVRSGTLVAIKKISPRPAESGLSDMSRQSEAFRTICQEIAVCRHPSLQRHENISKLLYVAWQRLEKFPWIVLELAAFGTLEDILTAPGEGPTQKQKWNLTVDVTFGVAALHKAGIAHGDLKPTNILIHRHPQRQIVGQIADFGGSVTVGEGDPSIGTPLWCSPEVALAISPIDWKLADTWSYGLILASIWSRHSWQRERVESSCFLEQLVPQYLEDSAREAWIFLLKSEPDDSPNSIIACCRHLEIGVLPLLSATLSSNYSMRKPPEALAQEYLASICTELNREYVVYNAVGSNNADTNRSSLLTDNSHEAKPDPLPFKVWAYGYRSRDFEYQRIVYEHLAEAARPLREALEADSIHDTKSDGYIVDHTRLSDVGCFEQFVEWSKRCQHYFNEARTARSYRDRFGRQPIIALQVALSHCLKLGVEPDDKEIVSWTYVAARGGHSQAPWMAPLLEASCALTYLNPLRRTVYLTIGACIGSLTSLAALQKEDPVVYDLTLATIRSRHRPDFDQEYDHALDSFDMFLDGPPLESSSCSLLDALKSQNVERARTLLEDPALDASDMFDQQGRSILHALTYVEDENTKGLALLACVHGAPLPKLASLQDATSVMMYREKLEGTAIYGAAIKGMVHLFTELLQLHVETDTAIVDAMAMMMRTASLHQHEILGVILTQFEHTPELFTSTHDFGSDDPLQVLLGTSLTLSDYILLSRRLVHGPNYRTAQAKTLQLLLSKGANVSAPCFGYEDFTDRPRDVSAVSLAISNDDDVALSLLLDQPKASSDTASSLEEMSGTLQQCVVKNSLRCLKVISDAFPELINFVPTRTDQSPTLTPLNMAARNPRPECARLLLEKGADTSVYHDNWSPLARAIGDGYLETAKIIYEYCSDAERHQTFGYNAVTGFTMTGRIMSHWKTRRKTQGLIDVMKWCHTIGYAYSDYDNRVRAPIWTMILCHRASSSVEQANMDNLMLAALFDMFPDKLDLPDPEGFFPIHRATMNGHRKGIEMLLERGVNIDAECLAPPNFAGATSFTLAAMRIESQPPPDVRMGGRLEVHRWRECMQDILGILIGKGATIGQHPRQDDLVRSLQYTMPNAYLPVTIHDMQDQGDEFGWGEDNWPHCLPRDETSKTQIDDADLFSFPTQHMMREIVPWPENEQYERLLVRMADARRTECQRRGTDWCAFLGSGPIDTSLINPSWEQWHSSYLASLPEGGIDKLEAEQEERKRAKGKGKMPAR